MKTPIQPSDAQILALYHARDEEAIRQTDLKYRSYLYAVAQHILRSVPDTEECINDAYLDAWNTIPPAQPRVLAAYLVTLVRRRALDAYRRMHRQKRGGGLAEPTLPDGYEPTAPGPTPEEEAQARRIGESINTLLSQLTERQRYLFVGRYYLHVPVSVLARAQGRSRSAVQKELATIKAMLRTQLESEDITL